PARVPSPLAALALRDLGDRAAAHDRQRLLLEHVRSFRIAGLLVLGLDQQPGVLLFPGPAVHANEMPAPRELLALEREIETTFPQSRVRVAVGTPMAAIPDQHR